MASEVGTHEVYLVVTPSDADLATKLMRAVVMFKDTHTTTRVPPEAEGTPCPIVLDHHPYMSEFIALFMAQPWGPAMAFLLGAWADIAVKPAGVILHPQVYWPHGRF